MVSEDILAVHRDGFSLWGTTSKLAHLPFNGCSKMHHHFTLLSFSLGWACDPCAGAHCPLTAPLAPQACPHVAGPQGCPPFVPVFHASESSSEGRAHEGFPCGAPQGRRRARCRHVLGQGRAWESCKALFRRSSHGLSSLPLPFRQFGFCYINEKSTRSHLLLSWCSLLKAVRLQEAWRSLEPWLELREDTHISGSQRWGQQTECRRALCCPAGVPERPCLPTGWAAHWEAEGVEAPSAGRT